METKGGEERDLEEGGEEEEGVEEEEVEVLDQEIKIKEEGLVGGIGVDLEVDLEVARK